MIARIEQPNRWTAAVLQQLNHWFVLLCVLSHAFCCKTKQNWIEVDPVCAEPEGLKTTKIKSEFILSRWRCSDWNSAIYSLSSNLVNLMGVKSKPFNRLFIAFMYWYNTICRANVGAGDACDCIFSEHLDCRGEKEERKQIHMIKNIACREWWEWIVSTTVRKFDIETEKSLTDVRCHWRIRRWICAIK